MDAPSPDAFSAARNLAFEDLIDKADTVASYARSIVEAAYRGDELTVAVHLRQGRTCWREMIETFNAGVVAHGKHGAAGAVASQLYRQDQRPGDGVA